MASLSNHTQLQRFLILSANLAVALGGLVLVRHAAPAGWLQDNNDVAGNYLQTVGTIYAVLLAFVVFVVWQQHNDTRCAVEAEANELSDFERTIQALPGTEPVQEHIFEYGRVVVAEEWNTMQQGRCSERADQTLEKIWQTLQAFEPHTGREEVIFAEVLARFNDLSDARSHRLHCSLLRLPPSMWALLLINGGLVVASMWLFGLKSFLAHAVMTMALAGSIAFILYLISDLDNPFWGSWRIRPEPFRRVLRHRFPEQPELNPENSRD